MKLARSTIHSILLAGVMITTVLAQAPSTSGQCASTPVMSNPAAGPQWNGWGAGVTNMRFQEQSGLTAAQVPNLKLKWAFGIEGGTVMRGQPSVAGGRLFVANETGIVHALDAKTGCTYWSFKPQAGVRNAISIGPRAGGYAIYFADVQANAYALDAATGRQLWVRKVDAHPAAKSTGSPTLHDGRLYVTVAGVTEENTGSQPAVECCTFRGSVSALNAATGEVMWKSYTIQEEPKPRGKSTTGVQLWGPAGAGVWSAPTIDVKRSSLYVATGNNYADPATKTSDAVVAFDLQTGKLKWASQVTPNDVWIGSCGRGANPNCPQTIGPDFDFAASPILVTQANGRDLIVIPQKSGLTYALDPDKEGAVIWQYRHGRGSGIGGVWGAAADRQQVYIGNADYLTPQPGGIHGVRLDTGARGWYTPPQTPLCGTGRGCSAAQAAAVTVMPGVVFSVSADGGIRAYSTADGTMIWQFDTNREFVTVNGVTARGGSMDQAGPVVAGGMLYVGSGNGGLVGRPGNVLLAFGVE
jgi:polyvinyl alcohol dehydrogenase (cytochrome)